MPAQHGCVADEAPDLIPVCHIAIEAIQNLRRRWSTSGSALKSRRCATSRRTNGTTVPRAASHPIPKAKSQCRRSGRSNGRPCRAYGRAKIQVRPAPGRRVVFGQHRTQSRLGARQAPCPRRNARRDQRLLDQLKRGAIDEASPVSGIVATVAVVGRALATLLGYRAPATKASVSGAAAGGYASPGSGNAIC
jgi:hypothetical protein